MTERAPSGVQPTRAIYIWRCKPQMPGAMDRVLVRGARNSDRLEFEDGFQIVASRTGGADSSRPKIILGTYLPKLRR
jgi:hypothetical protein